MLPPRADVGETFEKAAEDPSKFPDNAADQKKQEAQKRADEIRHEMAE